MINEKLIEQEQKTFSYTLQAVFFFIASICVGIGIYEAIPLNHVFEQSFHVGQQQVVLIGSVFSLGYAIGFLIFGWLANYFETKNLLLAGLFLLMVSTVATGFAATYSFMMILRAIQGVFAASFGPLGFSIIIRNFPDNKRVAGISAVTTGFVMAGILGQLYGSIIISSYKWSVVFWMQGLIYGVMIIFMVFLIPKTGEVSTTNSKTNFIVQLSKLLVNKSLLPCYIITVTLLFSFVGMYTVMGAFFQKSFGVDTQKILLIRGIGIIGMIGSMLFAKLSKKLGMAKILSLGLICASVSVLIIGLSNYVGMSIVMSIIFVFGITVSLPMIVSLIGIFAGKQSGNAMTLYTFILFIGATLGPIICNEIMDRSRSYSITFVFLAIVLGISSIISLIVRKNQNIK